MSKRDQVLHGDMAGQAEPVSARNRDLTVFQAARQRMDKTVALAHQDENVAGRQPAAFAFDDLAVAQPVLDGRRDMLGHGTAGALAWLTGKVQSSGSSTISAPTDGHTST